MPPPTVASPPTERRSLTPSSNVLGLPAPTPAAPIRPRELWTELPPPVQTAIRQALLHVLQEVVHAADRH
jgi:hypothetical protein